jgi:hypothetical protein
MPIRLALPSSTKFSTALPSYGSVVGLRSGAGADALTHVQFEVECRLWAQLRRLLKALLDLRPVFPP